MYAFEYRRPTALSDLRPFPADAVLLAGGQSLIPALKSRVLRPSSVVDIKGLLPSGIRLEHDRLVIGAGATHAAVAASSTIHDVAAWLTALVGEIGDPAVRHRGTVGGALAANHPASDWGAVALVTDAILRTDRREVSFADLTDGRDRLSRGEVILEAVFGLPEDAAYVKLLHPAERYALVGSLVSRTDASDVRIAISGAARKGAFRWLEAEAALESALVSAHVPRLQFPDDDLRNDGFGSPEYRRHLAAELTRTAVAQLAGHVRRQVSLTHGQGVARAYE